MFLQIAHLISKSGSRIPPRTSHIATGSSLPASQKRHNLSTFPHFTLAIFRTSMYLLASNKYKRFVLYLTKPGPGQTKILPAPSFVSYSKNHRCTCRRPTSVTRVRAISHETRPQSHIKFPPSLCHLSISPPSYLSI